MAGVDLSLGEIYFYAHVRRIGNLATFAEEVAALGTGQWRPAGVDFRAIALRSNGMKKLRPDAEIEGVDGFFRMLAEPAIRFNFFAYFLNGTPPQIPLRGQVQFGSYVAAGEVKNGVDQSSLDVANLDRIGQLAGFSTDAVAQAVRDIRKRNEETRKAVIDEMGEGVRRQLWLYLCVAHSAEDGFPPIDTSVPQALADLVGMDVFAFPDPIWYRPELQLSPPDELRGRISSSPSGATTKDVHTLDGEAQRFP